MRYRKIVLNLYSQKTDFLLFDFLEEISKEQLELSMRCAFKGDKRVKLLSLALV